MDFSSICRTCLTTKYLNPIFNGEDHDSFSATVLITTGLKVEVNDGLPQQMCRACTKFLKDAIKFREQCREAEMQLLCIKNGQNNSKTELKNRTDKSSHKRKKSKDVTSDCTSIKMEPYFENDDNIPLLQQRFNFTNLSVKHSNVKIETEFLRIDEIEQDQDSEFIKNEEVENKMGNDSDIIDLKKIYQSDQMIDIKFNNQFANDDNIDENKPKIDYTKTNLESLESEAIDETKYETEFLDLNLDSDTDEHLTKHMEIIEHNSDFPKYSTEFPNYNENPEDKYIPTQNTDQNFIKIKKPKQIASKDTRENSQKDIKNNFVINEKLQNNTENKSNFETLEKSQMDSEFVPFTYVSQRKKKSRTDIENAPFIIQDTNRVTCKICQKDLSIRSIDSHMAKSHPGADIRKEKCDLCDTFVFKTRLDRHKIVMHGQDCFRCGYCKNEYESKEMLLDHVTTCSAKKRKRKSDPEKRKEAIVECDVCNKSMQKASLRMHKEIKHAGMGPVCEHCGRRFGNKFRLSEHLRAKHGYEKFKCSMCDFLSASRMALKNHERRHRGEKPYVCERCGAKFHAPHLLTQHKQSHRTEKNMKCDQCPAAFKANNTLHMHKITCHNPNTYQCPMCPRSYSARHYTVKHLRAVHHHTGAVGDIIVEPKQPHERDVKSPTTS